MSEPAKPMREPTYFVLASLFEGSPLHGCGIIRRTGELSAGRIRLVTGTLYTALDRLTRDGYVSVVSKESVAGRVRRRYGLTGTGHRALRAEAARLGQEARVVSAPGRSPTVREIVVIGGKLQDRRQGNDLRSRADCNDRLQRTRREKLEFQDQLAARQMLRHELSTVTGTLRLQQLLHPAKVAHRSVSETRHRHHDLGHPVQRRPASGRASVAEMDEHDWIVLCQPTEHRGQPQIHPARAEVVLRYLARVHVPHSQELVPGPLAGGQSTANSRFL